MRSATLDTNLLLEYWKKQPKREVVERLMALSRVRFRSFPNDEVHAGAPGFVAGAVNLTPALQSLTHVNA